jgi:ribosomal protein S18 acetylase RimI-like enzyme
VRADYGSIANLIHFQAHLHRHLDWVNPLDWIGSSPYLVVEIEGRVTAALGCPPDPPQVAWVRLFVCSDAIPLQMAWDVLWKAARNDLTSRGHIMAAAILLQDWFQDLLQTSGFQIHQQIVMLTRESRELPETTAMQGIKIRSLMHYDLPAVAETDAAAFDLLWQNSLTTLNHAYPQAAWATVAESDQGILGYQMSTRNPLGGHLARLAVRHEARSRGVGYALVADLIHKMAGQGLHHLTVNTQSDNQASLSLYRKVGFNETGDRYPVFVHQVG